MPGLPPAPRHVAEFTLGVPAPIPLPRFIEPPANLNLEDLVRSAFAAGNRMIVITKDQRGLYQTSMKRRDGNTFAVEVNADVIRSIRGALSLL